METRNKEHYQENMIKMLECVWGEGYLSPGGPEEVARTIGDYDISGLKVLDIGCGTGGIDIALVTNHKAGHVTGIDVEKGVLLNAQKLIEKKGLTDRINLVKVEPGPLPFDKHEFDIVFSKDSIIHIPDKHVLMNDVFRILKPGGRFIASDWLIGTDTVSDEMKEYIEMEGLDLQMASPSVYRDAMKKAGFINIKVISRNMWYRQQARSELKRLKGPRGNEIAKVCGRKYIDDNIKCWEKMISVLDTGEHCPSHLYGLKPS